MHQLCACFCKNQYFSSQPGSDSIYWTFGKILRMFLTFAHILEYWPKIICKFSLARSFPIGVVTSNQYKTSLSWGLGRTWHNLSNSQVANKSVRKKVLSDCYLYVISVWKIAKSWKIQRQQDEIYVKLSNGFCCLKWGSWIP